MLWWLIDREIKNCQFRKNATKGSQNLLQKSLYTQITSNNKEIGSNYAESSYTCLETFAHVCQLYLENNRLNHLKKIGKYRIRIDSRRHNVSQYVTPDFGFWGILKGPKFWYYFHTGTTCYGSPLLEYRWDAWALQAQLPCTPDVWFHVSVIEFPVRNTKEVIKLGLQQRQPDSTCHFLLSAKASYVWRRLPADQSEEARHCRVFQTAEARCQMLTSSGFPVFETTFPASTSIVEAALHLQRRRLFDQPCRRLSDFI